MCAALSIQVWNYRISIWSHTPVRFALLAVFSSVLIGMESVSYAASPNGQLTAALNERAAQEANRGDWSRWRGAASDGISREAGLLQAWPKDGPPLAWRTTGLGKGYSSVSVVGDRIYTMGLKDKNSTVKALNRADGSPVWETALGTGSPNCTPTLDGESVYAISLSGELARLSSSTGEVLWKRNFQTEFGAKKPGWGFSESPLVDGDAVVCSPGSRDAVVVAFDKRTGKTLWKTALTGDKAARGHGSAGYASPIISEAGGVKQYITLTGYGVVGVDAETGELLWRYDRIANGTANIPTPIVQGDYCLCSSGYGDGGTALLHLTRKGEGIDAREVYYFPANKLQNHHGGMILHDGYVYMGHGHNNGFPLCFDFQSGRDAWRPGRGPGSQSAAVAYADGRLYFRYQDGTIALIEAKPDAYRVKGQFKMASHNGESWPHPVIAGGRLYLRDQDELLVYDVRSK